MTTLSSELAAGTTTPQRQQVFRAALALLTRWLSTALLVVVGAAGLTAVTGAALHWWAPMTVLTGSMRPTIQPGDVEVLRSEPVAAVRVGQILALRPPGEDIEYGHRVVKIVRQDGTTWVRTKGDANPTSDPWGLVRLSSTRVWYVGAVIPKLGYLQVWAHQRWERIGFAAVAIVLLAWLALRWVWQRT